jgi:hypothetical protein
MNRVLLQLWEESNKDLGQTPDGCSLHIDLENHKNYVNDIYLDRKEDYIPETYERVVGLPVDVYVNDAIYSIMLRDKSVRLLQHELNNLINLNEIELEND